MKPISIVQKVVGTITNKAVQKNSSKQDLQSKLKKQAVVTIDHVSQLTEHPLLNKVTYRVLPSTPEGDTLSPFLEFLRRVRRLSLPPKARTVESLRASFHSDMKSFHQGYAVGAVEELSIPINDDVDGVESANIHPTSTTAKTTSATASKTQLDARLYQPRADDSHSTDCPVLLVYFHGGGYMMGDLDTHDDACRLLCQYSGMQVLSVAYRLAPEHPYPTAVEDAKAVIEWVSANKAKFAVEHISIGGDSAGANLATVTAQYFANQATQNELSTEDINKPDPTQPADATAVSTKTSKHIPRLLAQLLIYPPTDASKLRPSHDLYGRGYFLDRIDRKIYYTAYYNTNDNTRKHITASPILNPNVNGLAPCVVATAGFDVLCDEGRDYAEYLQNKGISVDAMHFARLTHGFVNFVGIHSESRQAVIRIARRWRMLCDKQL